MEFHLSYPLDNALLFFLFIAIRAWSYNLFVIIRTNYAKFSRQWIIAVRYGIKPYLTLAPLDPVLRVLPSVDWYLLHICSTILHKYIETTKKKKKKKKKKLILPLPPKFNAAL